MSETSISSGSGTRWLSENPDKAWAEKIYLLYSPVWMTVMGLVMATGLVNSFGEIAYNLVGLLVMLPFLLIPAFLSGARPDLHQGKAWYETFWFKSNLYMWSFVFWGSYFGSEYFFDVLGMVYDYPMIEKTNFDAALLGSGEQKVPLTMYFLAHAYFMTYHTTAVVVLRRIKTSNIPFRALIWPVMIFVIGYFWAWMETKAMANPFIEQAFYYKDMARMLAFGSIMYAFYFISSFPIYYFLDEVREKSWSLWYTFMASCTAGMLTMYLLDFWTHFVGPIY
ncbi:MAG: hypothetical protein KDI30_03530 [Pseudomonadales bacterium]|nr:hypothetical protein [Pseudomonadales bacterium]